MVHVSIFDGLESTSILRQLSPNTLGCEGERVALSSQRFWFGHPTRNLDVFGPRRQSGDFEEDQADAQAAEDMRSQWHKNLCTSETVGRIIQDGGKMYTTNTLGTWGWRWTEYATFRYFLRVMSLNNIILLFGVVIIIIIIPTVSSLPSLFALKNYPSHPKNPEKSSWHLWFMGNTCIIGCLKVRTPLKTNISPEKWWLEDVFPIEIVPF